MFEIMGQAGCSLRYTQIVLKWHLDGQLAGPDFFFHMHVRRNAKNTRQFPPGGVWVDSPCLEMEKNVGLKLWVKLACSPR